MKKDQNQTPLLDALTAYRKQSPAYFRIPGHRYERGISPRWLEQVGGAIFGYDLSEAEGLDDLHNPQGVIREAQELAAEAFGAEHSYFLVNGTTCGNEAMILSSAWEGETILVPRNAHKSILMGLILSGARPAWLMPRLLDGGLVGGVTPEAVEEGFARHPQGKGVLLVSPTYYGLCSDLKAIGEICHRRGALLLVDEAHGAHLGFSDKLPPGALQQGADLCAQSIHKVAGSLTQSSLLHIQGKLADRTRVEQSLRMVQSTSPSYLLMASLDAARCELALHGERLMDRACQLADKARRAIREIPGMECLGGELVGQGGVAAVDPTRLVFSAAGLGLAGYQLQELLYQREEVTLELADQRYAVAVITAANTEEEICRLIEGIKNLVRERGKQPEASQRPQAEAFPRPLSQPSQRLQAEASPRPLSQLSQPPLPGIPPMVCTPREAWGASREDVPWSQAVGRIAGQALAPYPPGIPTIYPGERITEEIWAYLENFRKKGYPIHGAKKNLQVFSCIRE